MFGRSKAPNELFVKVAHSARGDASRRKVDVLEVVDGGIELVLVVKLGANLVELEAV